MVLVLKASKCDFAKEGGFSFEKLEFTTGAVDGCGNKHKDSCDPYNELCTAKLKEVIQAWRDAFVWQARQETVDKQCSNSFNQWLRQRLRPRQIALKPLLWEVCCDAYTCFKMTYEAAHEGQACFGVR